MRILEGGLTYREKYDGTTAEVPQGKYMMEQLRKYHREKKQNPGGESWRSPA